MSEKAELSAQGGRDGSKGIRGELDIPEGWDGPGLRGQTRPWLGGEMARCSAETALPPPSLPGGAFGPGLQNL